MKEINCIFCDCGSNSVVIEENGFQGKQCPDCGLIYISPRPSLDEIINLYGHDEAHISADSHISDEVSRRLYAKLHLSIITQHIKRGDVLEIGSGVGFFLDEAKKLGFVPHGLEFNPIQADYIRRKFDIPCEEQPVSEELFGDKKFDVVFHCDVISHLYDPIDDFKSMNKVMNDGGYICFETGNLAETDQKYFKYYDRFQYPDHLFFFNPRNLEELLEKTGFKLIKIHKYSILPQLQAIGPLFALRNFAKKLLGKGGAAEPVQPVANKPADAKPKRPEIRPEPTGLRAFVRNLKRYPMPLLMYLLRYKIGAIAPKGSRPQTHIVVAQKVSRAD